MKHPSSKIIQQSCITGAVAFYTCLGNERIERARGIAAKIGKC